MWLRAGLAGTVIGLDIEAGLKRIDSTGLDLTLVGMLAAKGEEGFLEGIALNKPAGEA